MGGGIEGYNKEPGRLMISWSYSSSPEPSTPGFPDMVNNNYNVTPLPNSVIQVTVHMWLDVIAYRNSATVAGAWRVTQG